MPVAWGWPSAHWAHRQEPFRCYASLQPRWWGQAVRAIYVNSMGAINGSEQIDADFFCLSAQEAKCMDPQQRFLLEVSWQALEVANIVPATLAGSNTQQLLLRSAG